MLSDHRHHWDTTEEHVRRRPDCVKCSATGVDIEGMPTLVAVFKGRDDSEVVLDRLAEHGIDRASVGLVWREKTVRKAEDIEVVTYVDHFEEPRIEVKKGALGGVIGGATAGAGSVLLATAGIAIGPGIASILGTGAGVAAAAAAVAGAASGGVSGGVIGALLSVADHDATKVTTTETQYVEYVETDGFVLTFDYEEQASDQLAVVLQEVGVDDISLLGETGKHLRTRL